MIRNLWIFLREVRWLAVLCVACVLAGLILTTLGITALGIAFVLAGIALGVLARNE